MRGADLSVHVASDLLAGLLVWMGAGWLLDRWLVTDPWFTVIGALVGYAAGLYLVWQRVRRIGDVEVGPARRGPAPRGHSGPPS